MQNFSILRSDLNCLPTHEGHFRFLIFSKLLTFSQPVSSYSSQKNSFPNFSVKKNTKVVLLSFSVNFSSSDAGMLFLGGY